MLRILVEWGMGVRPAGKAAGGYPGGSHASAIAIGGMGATAARSALEIAHFNAAGALDCQIWACASKRAGTARPLLVRGCCA
jgi:hypothetical protein